MKKWIIIGLMLLTLIPVQAGQIADNPQNIGLDLVDGNSLVSNPQDINLELLSVTGEVACSYTTDTTLDGEDFVCDVFKVSNGAEVVLKNSKLTKNTTIITSGSRLVLINSKMK